MAAANSVLAGAGLAGVGVVAAAAADVLAHTLLMPAAWRGGHSCPCYTLARPDGREYRKSSAGSNPSLPD